MKVGQGSVLRGPQGSASKFNLGEGENFNLRMADKLGDESCREKKMKKKG